jgi:hypothetical protein
MLSRLLELHFSQLQAEWSVSRYNNYSDRRKQDYHNNLHKIISHLQDEDFSTFTDEEITTRFYIIFFVFKSLEFLNHSTTSTIPFELVFVLEQALKDWSPSDDYLIVTSLINGMNEFSFDNSLTFFDLVYKEIEILYGVVFKQRLVQINLPDSTSRDYLANVVLYHELGHFVEKKYQITRIIYKSLIDSLKSGLSIDDKKDLLKFFPYLEDPADVDQLDKNYGPYNIFSMHIGEYFCDLFASQYILDCSNYYLEYITLNQSRYSSTHPSTINRIIFINDYLSDKRNFVLNEYKRIVRNITSLDINFKTIEFKSENFEKLTPVNISDSRELHYLFVYGWKVWLSDWIGINNLSGIKFKLESSNVYQIVNNLIEKSIGNYIVSSEWSS